MLAGARGDHASNSAAANCVAGRLGDDGNLIGVGMSSFLPSPQRLTAGCNSSTTCFYNTISSSDRSRRKSSAGVTRKLVSGEMRPVSASHSRCAASDPATQRTAVRRIPLQFAMTSFVLLSSVLLFSVLLSSVPSIGKSNSSTRRSARTSVIFTSRTGIRRTNNMSHGTLFVAQGVGRIASCGDNAAMEHFFRHLQKSVPSGPFESPSEE